MEKPLLFKSKRTKYLRSFVSSCIFTLLSVKILLISGSLVWILPAAIFILAGIASVIPLLPNQSYLQIHNFGITIRSMFRTIEIRWNEVEYFYPERKNLRDTVGFRFADKKLNYLNIANIISKNERLPDDYGMKASELADLLEYYRIRHSFILSPASES